MLVSDLQFKDQVNTRRNRNTGNTQSPLIQQTQGKRVGFGASFPSPVPTEVLGTLAFVAPEAARWPAGPGSVLGLQAAEIPGVGIGGIGLKPGRPNGSAMSSCLRTLEELSS